MKKKIRSRENRFLKLLFIVNTELDWNKFTID